MRVITLTTDQQPGWDHYVKNHPAGTLYHLSGWQDIIYNTYGHDTYYLMAIKNDSKLFNSTCSAESDQEQSSTPITGILPLVHIKHFIFGNNLVSVPFLDYGGILADDEQTEKSLLTKAIALAEKMRVNYIELRHLQPLACLCSDGSDESLLSYAPLTKGCEIYTSSHKVRMLLPVLNDSEALMKSFKSKLRSQIKKPVREGCSAAFGNVELLDDFYKVFSINMRDLGSPVHAKRLFKNILSKFPEETGICIIHKDYQPLAASIVVGFNDTLENPWASSLREFSRLSPNMLLYWAMIQHACKNGYQYCDFGRSSLGEGSYKFKQQWGAKPSALHWHYISLNGQPIDTEYSQKPKYQTAINLWKHLPVPVTKVIGPRIRKYIGL